MLGRIFIRGDRPIKQRNSWFSAKSIEVERLRSMKNNLGKLFFVVFMFGRAILLYLVSRDIVDFIESLMSIYQIRQSDVG